MYFDTSMYFDVLRCTSLARSLNFVIAQGRPLKVIWVQSVFTPTLGHAAVTYREIYDFVAYAMRACGFSVRGVLLSLVK